MFASYIGSIVRTGLGVVSGALLATGIEEVQVTSFADAAAPIVTGVLMYGLTQVWSLVEKKLKK